MTEATTITATTSTEEIHASAFAFNEQMMEELLGHQSDSLTNLPFVMSGSAFTALSSAPIAIISSDTQAAHDEAVMAEISAEMASVALGSDIGGGMAGPGLAPLRMVSSGGTIIITRVPPMSLYIESAPVPPTTKAFQFP